MRINLVGVGYVGLVTAACFSEMGNTVACVDVNENKVSGIKKGKIPLFNFLSKVRSDMLIPEAFRRLRRVFESQIGNFDEGRTESDSENGSSMSIIFVLKCLTS